MAAEETPNQVQILFMMKSSSNLGIIELMKSSYQKIPRKHCNGKAWRERPSEPEADSEGCEQRFSLALRPGPGQS